MSASAQNLLLLLALLSSFGSNLLVRAAYNNQRRPGRASSNVRNVESVTEWRQLEYGFANAQDRASAQSSGNLVPENGTPIDVQPQYMPNGQMRLFTTIPKFTGGIPYSLATVSMEAGNNGKLLQPYPNNSWHNSNGNDCNQITSAFRVAITPCNQMWVIDSGMIGSEQLCPPQLLLFNLADDSLAHRYRFPNDTYIPRGSLFITPSILVQDPPPRGKCARTIVYVADVGYHGLVIYDQQTNQAWRAEHRSMYPDPDFGQHTIAGEKFVLMDGLFAINNDKKNLYFHALASNSEYGVPLSVLNNHANWANGVEAMDDQFVLLGRRKSECAASAIDSRDNLYCVTFNPIKLFVWSVNTPYGSRNFGALPAKSEHLQFVSGMKVVRNAAGKDELWMLSNRYQKISAGTLNSNEVNFRILRRSLDDVQSGAFFPSDEDLTKRLVFT